MATAVATQVSVENRAGLSEAQFGPLAAGVGQHTSIKRALDWLLTRSPPLMPSDMITQDEFSHDIIVPLPNQLWLVYDSS